MEAGEEIEVLRDNRPVAKIIPLSRRRRWLPAAEIVQELAAARSGHHRSRGKSWETILTETTDDLPW